MQVKKDNRTAKAVFAAVTAATVLSAVGAGAFLASPQNLRAETALTPVAKATAPSMVVPQNFSPKTIADVFDRVAPAVVTVRVTGKAGAGQHAAPPQMEEFFKRFFGENGPGAPGFGDEEFGRRFGPQFRGEDDGQRRAPSGPVVQGLGSGFILDKDGTIVTNDHVVGDADRITVVLQDGTEYDAKLVGRDDKTDLAVLKIDAGKDLPHVSFGSSDKTRVGEWIVAVGNPFGLGQTVTAGIISAHHRDIGAGPFDDFLQIDAPINRGNSGGPAFNLKGEVIGVNAAIFSPSGGNVGIGFAIPSDLAKHVVAELKAHGTVERGWLGVRIQAVTPALAVSVGLDKAEGAIVTSVEDGSPAAKGGLKQGDVIVAVDGERIERMRELPRVVAALHAGHDAKIAVWRDGKERALEVAIGKMPKPEQVASAVQGEKAYVGMTLAQLDGQARRAYGIDDGTHGVLVTEVAPGSPAAGAGLVPGDVIVSVGGEKVASPDDVSKAIHDGRGGNKKSLLMLVARQVGGETGERFVALPLESA